MSKTYVSGNFYPLESHSAIVVSGFGVPQLKKNVGIYISYLGDTVKFIDNGKILVEIEKDKCEDVYLLCDLFCKYLIMDYTSAREELRNLVNSHVYKGSTDISGYVV